jgi:hypothetical protein
MPDCSREFPPQYRRAPPAARPGHAECLLHGDPVAIDVGYRSCMSRPTGLAHCVRTRILCDGDHPWYIRPVLHWEEYPIGFVHRLPEIVHYLCQADVLAWFDQARLEGVIITRATRTSSGGGPRRSSTMLVRNTGDCRADVVGPCKCLRLTARPRVCKCLSRHT